MTLRALISGGGIGGLTAALALRQAGIDAMVFERSPADTTPVSTGSGLTVWSNATRVLAELGLLDRLLAVGSVVESFENRTWRGMRLATWPIGDIGRRAGSPSINVSRADFHRILRDATVGQIADGSEFVALHEADGVVTARFAGGRVEHGDVLIGADGLRSQVRSQLRPTAPPRFAGYAVYRAIVADTIDLAPAGLFVQVWGRGARFGFYQVGGGRTYWFAVVNCTETDTDTPGGRRDALHQRFAGWTQPVATLLDATDERDISRVRIFDRDPARVWGKGRVTLIGDAIHPMTFNVGQGACQAIEDATALARELSGEGDPADALRRYEVGRMDRTERLVRLARRIGDVARWEAPSLCAARDLMLRPVLRGPARRQHERILRHL